MTENNVNITQYPNNVNVVQDNNVVVVASQGVQGPAGNASDIAVINPILKIGPADSASLAFSSSPTFTNLNITGSSSFQDAINLFSQQDVYAYNNMLNIFNSDGYNTIQMDSAGDIVASYLYLQGNNIGDSGGLWIKKNNHTLMVTDDAGNLYLTGNMKIYDRDYTENAPNWNIPQSNLYLYHSKTSNINLISGINGATNNTGNIVFSVSKDGDINANGLTVSSDAIISGIKVGTGGISDNTSVAIGLESLYSASFVENDYNGNVAVGYQSLRSLTGGSENVAIGPYTLTNLVSGLFNTAIGTTGLYALESGNNNTSIGQSALVSLITGNANIAIGSWAGLTNASGDNNIYIGNNAGRFAQGSNKLYISNNDTNNPLIYGDFSASALIFNGSVTTTGTLIAGQIQDTPITLSQVVPTTPGAIYYEPATNALSFIDGTISPQHLGQQMFVQVVNDSNTVLPKGTAVYLNGVQGNRPVATPAIASSSVAHDVVGLVYDDIAAHQYGLVLTQGLLEGIDTRPFTPGAYIYLSASTAGGLTGTKPSYPNYAFVVAQALNSTPNGKLLVEPYDAYNQVNVNGAIQFSDGYRTIGSSNATLDLSGNLNVAAASVSGSVVATQSYVTSRGYVTSTGSVAYATNAGNSTTTSQTNFSSLTISGSNVATQAYVTGQGYVTSSGSVAGANNSASLGGQSASYYYPASSINSASVAYATNAGNSTTTSQTTFSTLTVNGDINVSGNAYLSGSTTIISASNLSLKDPLLYLADGNPSNINDIGLVGSFTSSSYQHTGLVRDHNDGVWKLFSGVSTEPTTVVNFASATWDTLQMGNVILNPTPTSVPLTINASAISGNIINIATNGFSSPNVFLDTNGRMVVRAIGVGYNNPLSTTTFALFQNVANSTNVVTSMFKAISGQTADLQQWQNSSGSVLGSVGVSGTFTLTPTSGTAAIIKGASGQNIAEFWSAGAGTYSGRVDTNGNWRSPYGLFQNSVTMGYGTTSNEVHAIVQGAATQTVDLQQWQNSSGSVLSTINASGQLVVGSATPLVSTSAAMISVYQTASTIPGIIIRRVADSGANMQEWQNSGGAPTTYIDAAGRLNLKRGAFLDNSQSNTTTAFTVTNSGSSTLAMYIRGAASQTANLQEWQNSSGTILSTVNASGQFVIGGSAAAISSGFGSTPASAAMLSVYSSNASAGGLIVRAASAQSSNLLEFQDVNGTFKSGVIGNGDWVVGALYNTYAGVGTAYSDYQGAVTSLYVKPTQAGRIGAIVRGLTGQTGDLQQWQNSSSVSLFSVGASGGLTLSPTNGTAATINAASTSIALQIKPNAANALTVQNEAGTATTAFIDRYGNVGLGGITTPYSNAALSVYTGGSAFPALIIRGASAQSFDLQQWQKSDGTVLSYVNSGGNIFAPNAAFGTSSLLGSTHLGVNSSGSTIIPVMIRAASAQTADLTQWQDSTGAVLSSIDSSGRIKTNNGAVFGGTNQIGVTTTYTGASTNIGMVIKGASAQAADLTQWQNVNSSILARVDNNGVVYGAQLRTINGIGLMLEANSGGQLRLYRSTTDPSAPGTSYVQLYTKELTASGNQQIWARSGSAGAPILLFDNLDTTNATSNLTIGASAGTLNVPSTVTFAIPPQGIESRFNMNKTSDSAWISTLEWQSDNTNYEFGMRDNPDGGDYFQWRWEDYKGTNVGWMPMQIGGMTTRFIATSNSFWGNISMPINQPFFTANAGQSTGANLSSASGDGTTVTYNTSSIHRLTAGSKVSIINATPSAYNLTDVTVASIINASAFTVTNSATGAYVSGGTLAFSSDKSGQFAPYTSTTKTISQENTSGGQSSSTLTVDVSGYTGGAQAVYVVIDGTNTFRWGYDYYASNVNQASGVAITGSFQYFQGIGFKLPTTGTVVGDRWTFRVYPAPTIALGGAAAAGSFMTLNPSASVKGLVIKGASGQSSNLQEWQNSAGSALAKVDATGNITASGNVIYHQTINLQSGSAYTLQLTDDGVFVTMTSSAANTITIPAASAVAWQVGTRVDIIQQGAGATTIVPGTGASVNYYSPTLGSQTSASSIAIKSRYAAATLLYTASNSWLAIGNFT